MNTSDEERKQWWYFTFGFDHPHRNRFVKIFGTCDSTREEMFYRFGTRWSMHYDEKGFADQAKEYNLEELA